MNLGCSLPGGQRGWVALRAAAANSPDSPHSTLLGMGRYWAGGELIVFLESDNRKALGSC